VSVCVVFVDDVGCHCFPTVMRASISRIAVHIRVFFSECSPLFFVTVNNMFAQEIAQLKTAFASEREQRVALEEQLQKEKAALVDEKATLATTLASSAGLQARFASCQSDLQKLRAELDDAKKQLREVNVQLKEAEHAVADSRGEARNFASRVQLLQEAAKEARDQNKEQRDMMTLHEQAAALKHQKELQAIRTELEKKAEADKKHMQQQVTFLQHR
jgi:chromosome segregation ATPase